MEHPPCYTAGTSAEEGDLLKPRFPIYRVGRGGRWTYHGPGQRVAYVIRDLRPEPNLRGHVQGLMHWVARALASVGVEAAPREGRVGLWTPGEEKIAAIGVRIRRWVTFHGIAINVEPDLEHFGGIVPCGIGDEKLGKISGTVRSLSRNRIPQWTPAMPGAPRHPVLTPLTRMRSAGWSIFPPVSPAPWVRRRVTRWTAPLPK